MPTADTLISAISGASGSGTLTEVTFTAIATGTSSIDLSNVILRDSGFNSITASLENGTVIVTTNTAVTPEPNALALMIVGMTFLAFKFAKNLISI